ncbi:MAG TPA: hypothetical protein VJ952_03390 [Opitutales bacterium]|nr:hypothetical protein [Opitutales bacterium]
MAQFVTVLLVIGYFLLTFEGRIEFMANRVFVFLGSISYSLYLIHNNVGHAILFHSPIESYYG